MKSQHFLPLFLVLYSANAKKAAFPAFPVFHPLSPASFPRDALLPTPCIASLPQRVPVSGRLSAWRQRLRAPDMRRTPGISRRNIPFFQKRKKLHLRIADAAFSLLSVLELPVAVQHLFKVFAGVRLFARSDLLGRTGHDQFTAAVAALRAEIQDIVSRLDDV